MKFKVIYEYFEIIDANSIEVREDEIVFVSGDSTRWTPKYMIKTILPEKEFQFDDEEHN